MLLPLVHDSCDQPRRNGLSSLPDIESLSVLDGERMCDLADHLDVVTWHDHFTVGIFDTLGEVESCCLICDSGNVSSEQSGSIHSQNVPAVRI